MADDDIEAKAVRILKELAHLSNATGIRAYKVVNDSFIQAVGMKWEELRRVMPYLVSAGWATNPTTTSLVITAKGLGAAKGIPKAPPLGPRVVALDFAFVTDAPLRVVLERDAVELKKALDAEAWTASIVLAGAIAEGVLIFGLKGRQAKATAACAAVLADPKRNPRGYKPKPTVEDWQLWFLVEVADEMDLLKGTTKGLTHSVLREFRNMVHPYVQIRDNLTPDETAAEGSRLYLTRLSKTLETRREQRVASRSTRRSTGGPRTAAPRCSFRVPIASA